MPNLLLMKVILNFLKKIVVPKMYSSRNFLALCASCLIIVSCVTIAECKTVASSSTRLSGGRATASNVFWSVAKSLATEAFSQVQETARRNPRLGFNITMLLPPGLNGTNPLTNNTNLPSFPGGLESAAQLGIIGIKGAILGIKTAIVQAIVAILFIVFLLTGIAYFACNIGIVSCSNLGSSLGNLGGVGGGGNPLDQLSAVNPFSRTGYDYPMKIHRTTSAVYNALDEGHKKFT